MILLAIAASSHAQNIRLHDSAVAIQNENGGTYSQTVELSQQPSDQVTVIVRVEDPGVVTVSQTSLTFRTDNWNTPQTVVLTAINNSHYTGLKSAAISFIPLGGGFDGAIAKMTVSVWDDETSPPNIMLEGTRQVIERHATLGWNWGTTTVTWESTDTQSLTIDPADSVWTQAQSGESRWRTMTAVENDSIGNVDVEVRRKLNTDIHTDRSLSSSRWRIIDNDSPKLVFSSVAPRRPEGSEYVYTVRLSNQPTGPVTVTIAGTSGTDVSLDRSSLTFTTANWNEPQPVAAAVGEDSDVTDDSVTLTHTASGGGYESVTGTITITVLDDDRIALATSEESLSIHEGESGSFTLRLSQQPTSNVTVTIAKKSGSILTVSPASLTFTPQNQNWNTPQTVTVTAAEDQDTEENKETLTLTASGAQFGSASAYIPVFILDNDAAYLVLPKDNPLKVTEGSTLQYPVRLSNQPTAPVTVTLTYKPDTNIPLTLQPFTDSTSVSPTQMTFNAGNWNNPQMVSVVTVHDNDLYQPTSSIVHQTAGGNYSGKPESIKFIHIADDDSQNFAISPNKVEILQGETAQFSVSLAAKPFVNVPVLIYVTQGSGLTLDSQKLTFTHENWNIPQTVTMSASNTATTGESASLYFSTAVTGGSREGRIRTSRSVRVLEPETVTATISAADSKVTEGQSTTLTIELGRALTAGEGVSFPLVFGGSATRNTDYVLSCLNATGVACANLNQGNAAVTFTSGGRTAKLEFAAKRDRDSESSETASIELGAPAAPGGTNLPGTAIQRLGNAGITIENSDAATDYGLVVKAWGARFGRTVAEQAVEGVIARIRASRIPGFNGQIAGRSFDFGERTALYGSDSAPGIDLSKNASGNVPQAIDRNRTDFDEAGLNRTTRSNAGRRLLASSRFSITDNKDSAGGNISFHSRISYTEFAGKEGSIALDGEVTTGMLAADYAKDRWLAGISLIHGKGEGDFSDIAFDDPVDGDIESSLTAIVPYGAFQVSDQLNVWGAAGFGSGDLTLEPSEFDNTQTDIEWTMAAAGIRNELIRPPAERDGADSIGGMGLTLVGDALWTRTFSDESSYIAATESNVTRLRLGIEGTWNIQRGDGSKLALKGELGARQDGGDAETGYGVEVGGGIAWVNSDRSMEFQVDGRKALSHSSDELESWGLASSFAYASHPKSRQGLSFSISRKIGGRATDAADAAFASAPQSDRARSEASSRWSTEIAYGIRIPDSRHMSAPYLRHEHSNTTSAYSVGLRLSPIKRMNALHLYADARATWSESHREDSERSVRFRVNVRW